jgi:hypothetical protein
MWYTIAPFSVSYHDFRINSGQISIAEDRKLKKGRGEEGKKRGREKVGGGKENFWIHFYA